MEVYLNRIDGVDDSIISMYLSKRTLTRDLELAVREKVYSHSYNYPFDSQPIGTLHPEINPEANNDLSDQLSRLFKWGIRHYTMLRFIDLSFTVYGLHRGGQDDLDAHSMRMNNRIIRSSTRLASFGQGEMSSFYEGKIIPTDLALAFLGVDIPTEIECEGNTYVRAANGYILKGHEDDKDYKRGLYMLSIPSCFIFRIQLTEFAHVFKERNREGSANPEVKEAVESMTDQLIRATNGFVTRDLLNSIRN